jgi:hypothetical protein
MPLTTSLMIDVSVGEIPSPLLGLEDTNVVPPLTTAASLATSLAVRLCVGGDFRRDMVDLSDPSARISMKRQRGVRVS